MKKILTVILFATVVAGLAARLLLADDDDRKIPALSGRLIAAGIPGISAIAPVGTFLPGGPIPAKFPGYTQPGKVLDPKRILVGSTSNFGEPVSNPSQLPGSMLSIDPTGSSLLIVPKDFASAGGQSSVLGGYVQMYSAQNAAFLNSIQNPVAATANFTGVSNPLGLSINNAFGRIWPANAPGGLAGAGSSTILDPPGEPLAGAPNPTLIGGVYSGNLTNRSPQLIPGGLNTGAIGTALMGYSPDGSAKAVFAVVCADGSIVQEHTLKGLDGLAPAGTIAPVLPSWSHDDDGENRILPRAGVLLNYSPSRILYVTEVFSNSIAVVKLSDDGVVFHVSSVSHTYAPELHEPIDLAPVTMEASDPKWASNTTLDVQSDFYVANRGDNTIVRMRQDGTVVSVRAVRLANGRRLGGLRLNGIATSPDGSRIWVTLVGPVPDMAHLKGAVLELPSF